MYIPAARAYVRVEGRSQPYFVLAVDRDAETAYLVDLRSVGYVEPVKFSKLAPVSEDTLKKSFPV